MPRDAEDSRNFVNQLFHALAPRPSDDLPDYLEPGWDGEPDINPNYKPTPEDVAAHRRRQRNRTSEKDGTPYPVYGNDKPDPSGTGRGW